MYYKDGQYRYRPFRPSAHAANCDSNTAGAAAFKDGASTVSTYFRRKNKTDTRYSSSKTLRTQRPRRLNNSYGTSGKRSRAISSLSTGSNGTFVGDNADYFGFAYGPQKDQ